MDGSLHGLSWKTFGLQMAAIASFLLPSTQVIKTIPATTVSPYRFMKSQPPIIGPATPREVVDASIASAEYHPNPPPQVAPRAVSAIPQVGDLNIQQIITNAATRWGQDPSIALRVANCESRFDIYAHNPSGATGLFQFMPATFYGNGGRNLFDPEDQAEIAMKMWHAGQKGQWSCQ